MTFLRRAETSKGDVLNLYTVHASSTKGAGWFPIATDISRLGYGLAIVLSYPIMLFELRHVVLALLGADDDEQAAQQPPVCGCERCEPTRLVTDACPDARCPSSVREFQSNAPCGTGPPLLRLRPSTCRNLAVNVAIIAPCTAIALVVSDVDVVFGFIGSTMSPLIVFILPALFCEPMSVPYPW